MEQIDIAIVVSAVALIFAIIFVAVSGGRK